MTPTGLDLTQLLAEPLAPTLKGLAPRAVGQPLAALGTLGLSLFDGDLPLPVAVLHGAALAHNAAWMQAFTERVHVSLCPHGKTTMAPQLFDLQLRHGAWGITAATASHVRTYRRFGVQRVLLANELVDRAGIELVLDELETDPAFDFYALVDSPAAAERLADAARRRGLKRPLQLLLEVGTPGGRAGVRTREEGVLLGRLLRDAAPVLQLRGIEAFEGIASGDERSAELVVHTMLDDIAALAAQGLAEDWFASGEIIVSAGGSAFFDVAARVLGAVRDAARGAAAETPARSVRVVLRSGCYLSHDALHYARMQSRMRQRAGADWGDGPGLRNALEVWACVLSVPEPGRAICGLGKRDVSYDIELPQPLRWLRPRLHAAPLASPAGWRVTALNDQHAYLDGTGESGLRVGDMVAFGVGHPCTTFDRWPLMHVIDHDGRVTGGVRTFF